ncbi:hypothetical protein QQF64_032690 [Cirrhinus molitorella]|uniref:Uncharacterized protein n=1 Tax=Cirrhinus molitorella TaxID=172907 RepID=A0ABR3MRS1_9TELE
MKIPGPNEFQMLGTSDRGERLTVLEKREEKGHINGVGVDIRDSFLPFDGFKNVALTLSASSFDVQMAAVRRCLRFSPQ